MYSIIEERIVTTDGKAVDRNPRHVAEIFTSVTYQDRPCEFEIKLSEIVPGMGFIRPGVSDSDGELPFGVTDLLDSVANLLILSPHNPELSSTDSDEQERVASVVERVCEVLGDGDPYRATLATDLRVTVLGLMEKAMSPRTVLLPRSEPRPERPNPTDDVQPDDL